MIKYLQIAKQFDAKKMQAEVDLLGNQLWTLHFQVKHYDGEWSAIPLRSINGAMENSYISPVEDATLYKDTVLLQQSPYLKEVLSFFECPLMAVRLLKLTPGTQIHEHKDADLCFEQGLVRFHIPVVTNADIKFYLQGERMALQEGECWYMNLNLPHALHNKSKHDRIHLVIDATVNDWVQHLFASTRVTHKKEMETPAKHTKEECLQIIANLRSMNTTVGNELADELEKQLQ